MSQDIVEFQRLESQIAVVVDACRCRQQPIAAAGFQRMAGEKEERRIRRDPVGTGSALLKKVFGGL